MGARVLFTRGSPASSLQLYFPGLPTRSWTWSVWGTAVSGSGNTHITQSWRIRASHLPGHHGWFRDGRVTQVRHIRILPGFCQVSWEGWFEQGVGGGFSAVGETDLHLGGQQSSRGETERGRQRRRDRQTPRQRERDRDGETEAERHTEAETDQGGEAEPERGSRRDRDGATLRPAAQLRTHP